MQWLQDNLNRTHIQRESVYKDIIYNTPASKEPNTVALTATKDATTYTIHSQMFPLKEAEKIAEALTITTDTLIILGFGLGYIPTAIRQKHPQIKIILIEPDINLFYLALHHCNLSFIGFTELYIGISDSQIPSFSLDTHQLYIQKSQERLFPISFQRVKNKLNHQPNYPLSNNWKYKKFTTEQTRILFIDSSYVLTKECLAAIKNTGNLVHYIHIDTQTYDYEIFIKHLLNDINHFHPDFVLTINHLGFDSEGRLTELFSQMELPFVSWFVDSPNVILSTFDSNISDFCHIFVWDDDYIPELKAKGYKNCEYLPLATDTDIFYPTDTPPKYDVSFVGSSMSYAIHKNLQSWVHRNDLWLAFPQIVEAFIRSHSRHIHPLVEHLSFDCISQKEDYIVAILWKATQIYRKSGIDMLAPFYPTISGDVNWINILPLQYQVLPERWYYDDLYLFYNQSKINFNMTSLQMTNAINQRVFDVSACQSFIISDYRQQIDELFGGKENIVYFSDITEIPELVAFYLENEAERKAYAMKAYQHVVKYHTYKHRIQKMIDIVRCKV